MLPRLRRDLVDTVNVRVRVATIDEIQRIADAVIPKRETLLSIIVSCVIDDAAVLHHIDSHYANTDGFILQPTDRSRIYGVQLGRFVREYKGDGRVFGIKFRPGAFYPFLHEPVSLIANTSIVATRVFPTAAGAEARIFGCRSDEGMVTMAAEFLFANLPPLDPEMKTARSIVETIIEDREVTRVHHLVSRFEHLRPFLALSVSGSKIS